MAGSPWYFVRSYRRLSNSGAVACKVDFSTQDPEAVLARARTDSIPSTNAAYCLGLDVTRHSFTFVLLVLSPTTASAAPFPSFSVPAEVNG